MNNTKIADARLTKRVDAGKAFELRMKGLAYVDIAKLFGVSKQAVHSRLKQFRSCLDNPESIQVYEENVDKLLSAAQVKQLEASLDNDKLKAASTLQNATAFGIFFDKQRLIRGQSTQIIEKYDLTSDERETLRTLEARIINQDVVVDPEADPEPITEDTVS